MRGAGVRGVILAGSPDLVEEEGAGLVGASVEIESQAAFFLARRRDQRAEFGFKEHVLAFLGAEIDDESDCVFRKFRDCGAVGFAPEGPSGGFAGFWFRHVGGDCTPNSFNGKEEWSLGQKPGTARLGRRALQELWPLAHRGGRYFWSASLRPTLRLSKFRSVLRTSE